MLDLSGYVVIRSEVSMGKNMEEHRNRRRKTPLHQMSCWHGMGGIVLDNKRARLFESEGIASESFIEKFSYLQVGCKASSKEETCRSSERFVVMKMGDG